MERIIISDEESQAVVQQRDYKIVKNKDWKTIDWAAHKPIMGNCANSCIAHPKDGDTLKVKKWNQKVILKGWSVGDGEKGTSVSKVELSFDSG